MVKRSEMNFLRSSRLGAQARVVGQRSLGCLKRGQPCLHQLHELSTAFSGGLSLHLAFGSFFPPPSAYIFPLINQCDKCLVPLLWGFMAGRNGLSAMGA